jgi:hypothetical protein
MHWSVISKELKMKTKKLLFYLLAGILTGCVPSLHPLFTQKEAVFDEKLIGLWAKDSNDKETFEFTRASSDPNNKKYTMVYIDKDGKKGEFDATLGKLGSSMFLDLYPAGKLECNTPDFYNIHILPVHTFMKIEQIEPVLIMAMMKSDKMEKMLKDDPNLIKCEPIEDRLVLTASTEELQGFMKKHSNDKDLFEGIGDLKRVEPNKPAAEPNGISK